MTDVMTVRGPVDPSTLGVTDYHEHLYVEPPAWLHKIDPDFALDSVEKSAAELKTFAEAGGRTLVELDRRRLRPERRQDRRGRRRACRRSTSS